MTYELKYASTLRSSISLGDNREVGAWNPTSVFRFKALESKAIANYEMNAPDSVLNAPDSVLNNGKL